MSEEPITVVCGLLEIVRLAPPSVRAWAERVDGPFVTITCPICARAMLLSRTGRDLIASGRATSVLCSSCLLDQARAHNATKN